MAKFAIGHYVFCLFVYWQMEKSVFENTINDINAMFVEAEKMSCGRYCEGCLGCLTAYLVFFCMETHYEQASMEWGPCRNVDKDVKREVMC